MAKATRMRKVLLHAPVQRLLGPLREFLLWKSAGGVLLMACAVAGLVWANWPGSSSYAHFWHIPLAISVGGLGMTHSLQHWINDLLMAVFFFLVGLEIKRELLVGELASPRQALLPILAAVGGMLVPALLYTALTAGHEGLHGWGIPMATDIAFAVGVLALLGDRAPLPLKVFLTALAIVDDLGAVLVIALFYTAQLHFEALAAAGVIFLVMAAMNGADVRHPIPYAVLGAFLWVAVYESGVHATIAGVLAALTIPARRHSDQGEFEHATRDALGRMGTPGADADAFHDIEAALERVQTPMERLEHMLLPWVNLLIMPLFALANAGVAIGGAEAGHDAIAGGVALGLLVGKPVGIVGAAWLAAKSGLATLPAGVTWRQMWGAGLLGGIGFTMSIFIAGLAFQQDALLDVGKLGILGSSCLAGLLGWAVLHWAPQANPR